MPINDSLANRNHSRRLKVAILGSTGSIGTQTLDVIRKNPARFEVVGLASGGHSKESRALFNTQVQEFLGQELSEQGLSGAAYEPGGSVKTALKFYGDDVLQVADAKQNGADIVLNAIAGNAGLDASLTALRSGAELALANKESCVIGGTLLKKALGKDVELLQRIRPVDSEHSAIWQCLSGARKTPHDISKLILTASGGPFHARDVKTFKEITPAEALAHPTWSMGKLVSVNSATLMNKGLELIEAAYLFDIDPSHIEVTVHPTSTVHSFVQFKDGSTLAQCSPPDMRLPIAYALHAPSHLEDVSTPLDFSTPFTWSFEPVDESKFPALKIARDALISGPLYPTVMNAVNESNVYAFLRGEIRFTDIIENTMRALDSFNPHDFSTNPYAPTLQEVKAVVTHYSASVFIKPSSPHASTASVYLPHASTQNEGVV
ncbi:MAG: 1-deoxy-D-xylulose-5-phosphate reductoisomerase [Candidatus Ancillula sp.]|jgi:1-deoxy-D-xylulose-5-phosphate reductoisomerase|nr:1-deoxy-D-xylulose-5-phosphate reductoisomerase [Candidatus Ancillula sp.]